MSSHCSIIKALLPAAGWFSILSGMYILVIFGISGCTPDIEYDGPMQTSNIDSINTKLEVLERLLVERGLPVQELNPGLTRDEIEKKVTDLSYPFPEELYQLYMWKNGTKEGSDLFLFRDQQFSSLEEGINNQAWLKLYGVSNAFPFASFEGAFYVLPAEEFAFHQNLERPVVSVFEGVEVYFYSLEHLLDTQISWMKENVFPESDSSNYELEMPIWQRHNPGIFE
ncbi:MAG: hypothetical protein KTR29_15985 [Rhodothermaceae bacterium]|nr:hypothetical protein [Rhodothermaceae bacterium]